jgi:hypothetical protein
MVVSFIGGGNQSTLIKPLNIFGQFLFFISLDVLFYFSEGINKRANCLHHTKDSEYLEKVKRYRLNMLYPHVKSKESRVKVRLWCLMPLSTIF